MATPATRLAYSYIRFSDPSQAAGDSLRRQTEAAADWCRRNNARLETGTTFRDLGKSAFLGDHRKNPDRHALARFLKLVEEDKVPRGSYLIIENLDRLSREHIRPALTLLLNLIEAGVRIVQLKPVEMVFDESVDPMQVMMATMELSRGHNESALKSERVGKAWGQRRKSAREKRAVLTRRLPAWVEERGGKLVAVPDRAAVVRRIFALAGAGHGLYAIMRRLTEEGVPAFGERVVREGKSRSAFSGRWSVSYLHTLLKDRRAVGEFQPATRGKPDGDPIPDYFPRVVSDADWERARLGAKERYRRPGRVTADVNVFAGLVKGAREGASYTVASESGQRNPYRVLRSTAPRSATGRAYSFPLATFEDAVLGALVEIDPREVLGGEVAPDEALTLSGELARVEGSINAILGEMEEHGESPALFKRLREKEAAKADLTARHATARDKVAHPLSHAWADTKSLVSALRSAPDPRDARLRLRTALRRIVDSIWLLVVPRGRDRLAEVQIWFAGGGGYRSYLIVHRPPKANPSKRTEAKWAVRSFKHPEAAAAGLPFNTEDLRDPDQAACVLGYLENYPKDLIDRLLASSKT